MGKKDKAEMAQAAGRFVAGAVQERASRSDDAAYIFELVDKFAGYGFNKSHAAAYALVSLSHRLSEGELPRGVPGRLDDARHGQHRQARHVHVGGQEVGHRHPAALHQRLGGRFPRRRARPSATRWRRSRTSARRRSRASSPSAAANGPFKDLSDFAGRCNTKALNKRALETLAAAGAFDALEPNRALVHGNVEQMLAFANRQAANAAQGTGDLFGGGERRRRPQIDMRPLKAWTPMERLQHEFEAVGFFLSGHPLDAYASVLAKLGVLQLRGARGARRARRRRRDASPASSSRRASAGRRRATSSPSPCSRSPPASSRR